MRLPRLFFLGLVNKVILIFIDLFNALQNDTLFSKLSNVSLTHKKIFRIKEQKM